MNRASASSGNWYLKGHTLNVKMTVFISLCDLTCYVIIVTNIKLFSNVHVTMQTCYFMKLTKLVNLIFFISSIFLYLIHQPTYALNNIHSEASLKLLDWFGTGVPSSRSYSAQRSISPTANLGILSPFLKF